MMNELWKLLLTFLDDILELLKLLFPDLKWLFTLGTVAYVLHRMYKKWQKTKGANEVKQLREEVQELRNMMMYLIKLGGGTWVADSKPYNASGRNISSNYSRLMTAIIAAYGTTSTIIRNYMGRLKKMGTIKQVNLVPMIVAILGAIKLVLQAFGYDVINDDQINEIANGIAAIVSVVGIMLSNRKKGVTIGDRADYAKASDASDKHTI